MPIPPPSPQISSQPPTPNHQPPTPNHHPPHKTAHQICCHCFHSEVGRGSILFEQLSSASMIGCMMMLSFIASIFTQPAGHQSSTLRASRRSKSQRPKAPSRRLSKKRPLKVSHPTPTPKPRSGFFPTLFFLVVVVVVVILFYLTGEFVKSN